MEHFANISVMDFMIPIMLLIIGVFLTRLLKQFDQLLEKFDLLNMTMLEHKTDVEVIKEQISTHAKTLDSINDLWNLARSTQNTVEILRARYEQK